MDSIKQLHQLIPQNEDSESNGGFEKSSKTLRKRIIIGLFIFFFIILLVLIAAVCLVFFEIVSVQQQQQPVVIAKLQSDLIYEIEDLPEEKQILIAEKVITNVLVPAEADSSKLVRQPTDQKVELEKDATINCKFDRKVHCKWLRKSNLVDISIRYSYIEAEKDDGNDDCSIKITNIKILDLSSWQCVGIFNDQSSLVSNVITLEKFLAPVEAEEVIVVTPKDVRTQIGEDVQLDCKFNKKVNCAWMRRGEHIEIQGRYRFVEESDGADELVSDCSIAIRGVKKIDAGEWTCSSMADSNSAGITSSAIKLTLTT